MADKNEVSYTIRLRDKMTGTLKRMGVSVTALRNKLSKGLAGGLKVAKAAMKAFAVAALAAAAAAGAVAVAAIRMGKGFVDAASMAEETRSKFSAVFKEIAGEAEDMAEAISEGLGRNQTEVMGFMARLQDTFVPMGIARDQAMDMSGALVSLSYDLASFNPEMGSAAEVMDSLTSAMIGSHETVKKFGVIINDASLKQKLLAMGAEKVNGVFTEQDKAMARLQIIIEATSDAHGDLIRTQDSWFNSTEALTSKITGLKEVMGAELIIELQNAIAQMGGVDAIVDIVRTAFEFFTNVLTQIVIPTVANLMTNFAKFVKAMGGVDAAVMTVSEVVALMGKVFGVMWDSVKLVLYYFQQGLDTLKFVVLAVWDVFKLLGGFLGLGFVTILRLAAEGVALLFTGMDKLVIWIKDTAIGVFQALLNTLADLVEGIGDTLSWLGKFDLVPDVIAGAGEAANAAAAGLRNFSASQDQLKGGESVYKEMADGIAAFGDSLAPAQAQLVEFIDQTWADLGDVSSDFVDAIMEDVPAIDALLASIREGTNGIGTDYEALAEKVGQALEGLSQVEVSTPEQRDQVKALEEHLKRLVPPTEAAKNALEGAAAGGFTMSDAIDSMKGGAQSFTDRVGTMGDTLADLTEGALNSFSAGLSNALMSVVDGSKSAGEAFKEFAANFLMDITNMIIQALVYRAVAGALGLTPAANGAVFQGGLGDLQAFANGGTVDGGLGRFMPVKGYATGGPIVNKPHVALIGEGKHNEAVVPLPDGRSIPVDMQGDSGTQVNINIEAVDAASVDQLLFQRKDTLRSIISSAIAESRSFRGAIARA
jgi:hypothetical protein